MVLAKCMIAMSGGVDSSVAAWVLREKGYDCIGATMRLYDGGTCCDLQDVEDARAVCQRLGIPHQVFWLWEEFQDRVISPFASEYLAGRTPNPCIECNRYLKFQLLWEKAMELGCDMLATGHYARIVETGNGPRLQKGLDPAKDQSYVLYFLSREQLARTLFPLGDLTKDRVRAIAAAQGFVNAEKYESQDICFIPDGDYGGFLERFTGRPHTPGDFLDGEGRVLGRHRGAACYTLGQRKGLGVSAESRLYVTAKDMEKNTVTLGQNRELFGDSLTAGRLTLMGQIPAEGLRLKAKVRYRQTEQPCTVFLREKDRLEVRFDEPQRAITPGQALVLYDGDTVFGGGTIL